MPPDTAALIAGTQRHPLNSQAPVIVPAGPVVVELSEVSGPGAVRFDGRHQPVAFDQAARRATFAVDLKRATGFHEVATGPTQTYLFGTEDAKLRIDGVLQLLDYLGQRGLSWSGAMFFSGTDEVMRDPRLDRAWLDRRSAEVFSLSEQIADQPATLHGSRRRRAPAGVPDVGATHRLLRQRRDLIEEFGEGPISFTHPDGAVKTYAPREVIIKERTRIFDTPGNRRATALLDGTLTLTRSVLQSAPEHVKPSLRRLRDDAERLLLNHPFRTLHHAGSHHRLPITLGSEERFDERYERVVGLHRELFQARHWDPTRSVMPERAYAGFADQVYQRFCAFVLADHLELEIQPGGLAGDGPHFVGDRFELYVDTTPPTSVIADWRDDTNRPANLRPDLVLRERATGRVALVDAKYRNEGVRASADSLADVQLYLQAYSRKRIGIFYPPGSGTDAERWLVREISDSHCSIFEIPILPEPRLASFLEDEVDDVLEQLMSA